jgi:hypothetical protein
MFTDPPPNYLLKLNDKRRCRWAELQAETERQMPLPARGRL